MVNKKIFIVALLISMLLWSCAELFMPYDGGWAQNDYRMIPTDQTPQQSSVSKKSEIGSSTATVSKKLTESSQANSDDVELTVSGDGPTKDAATKSALRSAIELAYGAFVSANTHILNDAVVEDEIISSTSGNIRHYEYVSEIERDGKWFVVVKAVVSKGKLISYVKSKGGSVEISGELFVQNVEMERLHKKADAKVLQNCLDQIVRMNDYSDFFDYSISTNEPEIRWGDVFLTVTVRVRVNNNGKDAYNLLTNTLQAISVTQEEEEVIKKYGPSCNFATFLNSRRERTGGVRMRPKLPYYKAFNFFVIYDGLRVYLLNDNANYEFNCKNNKQWCEKAKRIGYTLLGDGIKWVEERDTEPNIYPMGINLNSCVWISGSEHRKYEIRYTMEDFSKLSEIKVVPLDDVHEKEVLQWIKATKNK